ncbi:hypothetical protein GQR58_011048 [Nymphon striatum]|nr:hypothetical protein GQR58_011048 [Nymphon striatum]
MEAVLQIKRTVEEKMQNPFHPSLATDKLMNISTGQILAATTLVDAKRLGLKAMDAATTTNADKIVQPKMETFVTHLKKIQKKIDPVKEAEVADSWEPLKELPPSAADAVYVVDAMAFIQRFNTLGSSTFGQLQESNPVLLPPEEYGRIVDGDRLIPVMKSKPSKPSAAKLKVKHMKNFDVKDDQNEELNCSNLLLETLAELRRFERGTHNKEQEIKLNRICTILSNEDYLLSNSFANRLKWCSMKKNDFHSDREKIDVDDSKYYGMSDDDKDRTRARRVLGHPQVLTMVYINNIALTSFNPGNLLNHHCAMKAEGNFLKKKDLTKEYMKHLSQTHQHCAICGKTNDIERQILLFFSWG